MKLSSTQERILNAASDRPDSNIEPLPANVTAGVRQRVIDGLLSRGLVIRYGDVHRISQAGYVAVGKEPAVDASRKALDLALVKTRPGTKQEALITLLSMPEGATIDELAEATGWLKHTVRGTMSHTLKKRLGLTITSAKVDGGERRYRIK